MEHHFNFFNWVFCFVSQAKNINNSCKFKENIVILSLKCIYKYNWGIQNPVTTAIEQKQYQKILHNCINSTTSQWGATMRSQSVASITAKIVIKMVFFVTSSHNYSQVAVTWWFQCKVTKSTHKVHFRFPLSISLQKIVYVTSYLINWSLNGNIFNTTFLYY